MKKYDDILARYTRMRAVCVELNNALLKFDTSSVMQAAKDLRVWHKGNIIVMEDAMPVLWDHAIHHRFKGGRNLVDHYVAKHPPAAGSEAATALAAMERTFFSLFHVDRLVKFVGVHVTDVLRDRKHFLADVNFSTSVRKGMVLATRVIPFDGFIMTTGAAQSVSGEVLMWIAENLERDGLSPDVLREFPPLGWAQLETSIIPACLHSEADTPIRYRDVPSGVPGSDTPT